MKYTIFLTRRCNLRCSYCYLHKDADSAMPVSTAGRVVDFIYRHAPADERISIGFFGGEPLLESYLLDSIASLVEDQPGFDPGRVEMAVVSNGTQLTLEIEKILLDHGIAYFVSCDGPPKIHDACRRFVDGKGTARVVERNLRHALERLPHVAVNAVIHPRSLRSLPETVRYFMALGLREIHLSPDVSARWTREDLAALPQVLQRVGELYIEAYRSGDPSFINLVDGKIAVILRGGYQPAERCRMGRGELAFAPSGRIYACERLVGDDSGGEHCIGDIDRGVNTNAAACRRVPGHGINSECTSCSLRELCMNWCGCSNFFATGFYNRVSAFQCAFERTTIAVALEVFQRLERELGPVFVEHLAGRPESSAVLRGQLPIFNPVAPGRRWQRPTTVAKEA